MAIPGNHLINLTYLENRLGELQLKNWWVAEQIGVDRKTLGRWLSGKVKTLKEENLKALATCLQCRPEDLILVDESAVIASKEEQSIAAELIVQENLLLTLSPLGQWPLLESIVKATMQPNLPLPIMGKLYNLLSICSWRQSELVKAKGFAEKALFLGQQIGHRGVIAQANCNLATIASYNGRLQDSIALYESVLLERQFLDEERTVAAAMSNLAGDYHLYGDFEKSRKTQLEAIALYTSLGLPLNMSIAYCGLGLLETEAGNLDAAEIALEKSLELADESNYIRGLSAHTVYLADVASLQGQFVKAEALLKEGFQGFEQMKLFEALNFEIRARFYRLQGKWAQAEADLNEGLEHAEKFPLEKAALFIELAKLWQDRGEALKAKSFKQSAFEIYRQSGALGRFAGS